MGYLSWQFCSSTLYCIVLRCTTIYYDVHCMTIHCWFSFMYFTLTVSMFHTHIPYGVGTFRLRLVQHLKQDSCASLTRFTNSSNPSIHSLSHLFYRNFFIHEYVCSFVRSHLWSIQCNAIRCNMMQFDVLLYDAMYYYTWIYLITNNQ